MKISKRIKHFLTSGLAHPYHLDESMSTFWCFWSMISFLLYFAQKFLLAYIVDSYKTPISAASGLGQNISQWAYGGKITLYRRGCDVITSHRR